MTALARQEAARLAELEGAIERGLPTFLEVGAALAEIRDQQLHRASHASFEKYARDRFGLDRRQAYRQIEAAQVCVQLDTPPQIESQVRELVRLKDEPDRAAAAWEAARGQAEAEGRRVTASDVRREVSVRLSDAPVTPTPTERADPAPAQPAADPELPARSPADDVVAFTSCCKRLTEAAARLDIDAATQGAEEAVVEDWRTAWTSLRDELDQLVERAFTPAERAEVTADAERLGIDLLEEQP